MAQAEKSPHRLKHVEEAANVATTIGSMKFGDVFVREGTPCMRVDVRDDKFPIGGQFFVANLTNGKVWVASEHDLIHPAVDVDLSFKTTRR